MLRRFSVCLLLLSLLLNAQALPSAQSQAGGDSRAQDAPKKTEPEAAKKFEPWDVEGDHGPTTTVEFDTDEGTWMSCDVSPDGRLLVFDLLGDIYRDASRGRRGASSCRAASRGRCSRAGRRTASGSRSPPTATAATTSGSMDAEGKNRRQVTKETTRLVNTPGVDARRAVPPRAQALDGHALGGRGRNLDVPRERRRQGRAAHREAELDGEHRRAGGRAEGALPLLRRQRRLRLQQERLRQHLLDRPLRHAEGPPLRLRPRRGRLRSARPSRPTANSSPSSAASA